MLDAVRHPEWALVIGGASCVWDDVLAWETLYGQQWDGIVVAANDVGAHWPRVLHHWVSLHSSKFGRWQELRRTTVAGRADQYTTWCQASRMRKAPHGAQRSVMPWPGGSSGMLAVQVAKEVGCQKVILCGVPMTTTAHFAETGERFAQQWLSAKGHFRAWKREEQRLQGWVKSMSGNTLELLGAPTVAWLRDTAQEQAHG